MSRLSPSSLSVLSGIEPTAGGPPGGGRRRRPATPVRWEAGPEVGLRYSRQGARRQDSEACELLSRSLEAGGRVTSPLLAFVPVLVPFGKNGIDLTPTTEPERKYDRINVIIKS